MKRLGSLVLVLCACGGDSNKKIDAATHDAPKDARPIDSAVTHDAPPDGPAGTEQLTVKNYLAWCSVSVNGGSASSAASQQVFVNPGSIALTAAPLSGFKLDTHMWHHTTGDSGTGEAGTVTGTTSATTATVVAGSAKCVWVCCPFTNGTGCPTADQCP